MTTATTTAPTSVTLTGTYELDPAHSRVGFVARHAMVTKVRGRFTEVEASGYFDGDDPTQSRLHATIAAASIDTGNADRDAHLRSNDFLDPDNHPEITFESTAVKPVGDGRYEIVGDLTVRGVTRPVTLDAELSGPAVDPFGNERLGLEARAVINRKDWGVNWNAALDTGGVLVGDKVTLEIDISAIRTDDGA